MKTHWKQLTNPDYIGAYSLPDGKDITVVIEKVVREMVTGTGGKQEECTVAYLKGQKPMILNATNSKMITKLHNTPYIEEWAGKSITIYAALTKLKGEDVECLRIRPEKPTKPELTPQHPKWDGAVKALQSGNTTIEAIKKAFSISQNNETLLCSNLK